MTIPGLPHSLIDMTTPTALPSLTRAEARTIADRLREGPITRRDIAAVWREETRRGRRTGRTVRVAR